MKIVVVKNYDELSLTAAEMVAEIVAAAFFFAEIAADVPALGARGSRVGQAPFRRPGRSGIVHSKRVGRAERFAAHRSC